MYFFIIDFSINSTRKHLNLFVLVAQASKLFLSVLGCNCLTDLTYSNFILRLRLKNSILNEFGYLFEIFSLPFDKLLFRPNPFMVQSLLNNSQEGGFD